MDSPAVLTVAAAIAVNLVVSPIPEFPTELYIIPYITGNIALFAYLLLWSNSNGYIAALASFFSINTIFLLTSTVLTAVRRLLFSPLTRFPGPMVAAVSGLWNANEARLGRATKTHKALHDKYKSDIIRIGPNELSIRDPEALERLYGGKYIRGTFNQVFNLAGGNNLATLREHEKHSAWKKLWMKGFTGAEVSHYIERVQDHAKKTLQILQEKGGQPINCGQVLEALAFDVTMDLAFSRDAGLQDGHGDRRYVDLINGAQQFFKPVGHLPHVQQIFRYLPLNDEGKLFIELSGLIVTDRQSLKNPRKDFLSHLLAQSLNPKLAMTQMDFQQQVFLTLVVGTHSVSVTLTQTLAALADKPEIQARIREELDAVYNGDALPPPDTVKRLSYLTAVVKEGLRMFPPLVGGSPAIVPKGGVALSSGDYIPQHTQVWVSQHLLHNDERYFPQASEFLPERWLGQDTEKGMSTNELVRDRRAWIPFGYGTHVCGGRALALEELKMLVLTFVRDFDIQFVQDGEKPFDYEEWKKDGWKDIFLTMIEDIDMKFVPKKKHNASKTKLDCKANDQMLQAHVVAP